jgi:GxxExxY protein
MTQVADRTNEISGIVVDAALKVHRALGPGLLESAYHACLLYELRKRGLEVASQIEMPIRYDNIVIDTAFRIDLLVEHKVVVELKALPRIHPVHEAQLLSYLKLSGCKVGLLINFHAVLLRDGITRMVN